MYRAAYHSDPLDETIATFIAMVDLAPSTHAKLNGAYDRATADAEETAELSRELGIDRTFPALAENWIG